MSGWSEAENLQPLNGSLLYPVAQLNVGSPSVRIQIKTAKDETVRYHRVIYDEGIYRLPAGFKSDIWQINLTGNTDVYSVQLGSTPRSLKQV